MDNCIYLDNNSTTPVDPAVLEAMLPYLTRSFGNPSNTAHVFGAEAAGAVERARSHVAALLGAGQDEVVFTSGATESNNLAILGAARKYRDQGDHVVTVSTEHKAVLLPCRQLEKEGVRVTYLPTDRQGRVDPDALLGAITDRTILVSVMAANNEIGTFQPVADIGRICKERGVLFHTDAVQALGKVRIDVEEMGIDLLSVSAHKMYGPKGVGALFVRAHNPRVGLEPLLFGGGQEGGLRSGTVAVPSVVGLGAACELAGSHLLTEPGRLRALRARLWGRLECAFPYSRMNGHPVESLPGLLNVAFPGVDGDALIYAIKGLAVSQGSSCSTGSFEPSHVLRAIGLSDELAKASIRFGIGRFNTAEEVDRAADLVVGAARLLKTQMPVPR